MKNLIAALLLAFACACASRNSNNGIKAPNAAIGGQVEIALRDAHAYLVTRPGGQNLRAFDKKRDRLTITIVEPIGYQSGQPVLEWRNGKDSRGGWTGAYVTGTAPNLTLVMARGSSGKLVNHEAKHVILEINGLVNESYTHDRRFFPEGGNVF